MWLLILSALLSIVLSIYLISINYRYLAIIAIMLFAVLHCVFVNSEVKFDLVSTKFDVFSGNKNYSILSSKGRKYLLKEFENEKIFCQKYEMQCDVRLIKNENNKYQFSFQELMLSKNVLYELKNCHNTKLVSENFKTKLSFKGNTKSDWIKSINNLEDNELTDSFKNLGMSFLLNSNGFLILTGYYLIDKVFMRWKKYHKIKVILYLPLILNLVLLNFSTELLRVVMILCIRYLAWILKIKINRWNNYIFIWSIILCVSPNWFISPGFIYSFVITFFSMIYLKMNSRKNFFKNLLNWSLLIIPLQAMFNYNLLFLQNFNQLFWQPILSIFYIFTLFTNWIPKIDLIYNLFFHFCLILSRIGEMFNLSWNIGHLDFIYYATYYFIYYIICVNQVNLRPYRVYTFLLMVFSIVCLNVNNVKNQYDFIAMINVGNGNSFLLHERGGKNIFFDIGSGIGKSKSTDQDFLKYYGLNNIEAVFISHTDQDHNNNINAVSKSTIIKKIYKNDFYFRNMKIKDINIKNFEYYNEKDPNDSSQVLLLNWKNKQFLFTGDLPKRIELQLIRDVEFTKSINIKGIDFLQVPHHGSKTSSSHEFIELLKPKICFISGENKGRLHFPDPLTLSTLSNNKCETYSTLGKYTYFYKPFLLSKNNIVLVK